VKRNTKLDTFFYQFWFGGEFFHYVARKTRQTEYQKKFEGRQKKHDIPRRRLRTSCANAGVSQEMRETNATRTTTTHDDLLYIQQMAATSSSSRATRTKTTTTTTASDTHTQRRTQHNLRSSGEFTFLVGLACLVFFLVQRTTKSHTHTHTHTHTHSHKQTRTALPCFVSITKETTTRTHTHTPWGYHIKVHLHIE